MKQSYLFPDILDDRIAPKPVNVASVPQRSPFRYPGGKTWFVPTFRDWVRSKHKKPILLVEPFVGGGIISLTALFEDLVDSVIMVEIDDEVAAVWQAVVEGKSKSLAKRILEFDLSLESAKRELSKIPTTVVQKAFQTILKNRTFHGGILANGSGFLKYGEAGKGILSRWYPGTLAKRFQSLDLIKDRIDFRQADGMQTILEYASAPDAIFFIDPPYTAGGKRAGKRLYRYYDLDHEGLFAACKEIKGDFLLTYDGADEVRVLARRHNFQMRLVPMTNTHHANMEELVIGKNLAWMDRFPAVHEPRVGYNAQRKSKKGPKKPR